MKVTIADATLQAIKDLMKKENKDALRINLSNFT
jgi:Fe-S cluster assembly iron-binding protein IscA